MVNSSNCLALKRSNIYEPGLHVSIFAIVTYYTIQRRNITRRWMLWLILNSTLFALGTINLACNINFNESAWINERQYPGGPFHFLMEQQTRPVLTLANVATILVSFLADGLLVRPTLVICRALVHLNSTVISRDGYLELLMVHSTLLYPLLYSLRR